MRHALRLLGKPGLWAEVVRARWGLESLLVRLTRPLGVSYFELRRYFKESTLWKHRAESLLDGLRFPAEGRGTLDGPYAQLLYVLTRAIRPGTVVETGVGNGCSSLMLLAALEANARGRLFSLELPGRPRHVPEHLQAGWMVPPELRPRWELLRGESPGALESLLDDCGPVDLFLHDSDSRPEHQLREFGLAWPRLREGGLLVADDAAGSDASVSWPRPGSHPLFRLGRRLALAFKRDSAPPFPAFSERFEANLRLYRSEAAQRKIVMSSRPIQLGILPTTRCNIDCVMCVRPQTRDELPAGTWEKVRPLLPYLQSIQWQGGEVFLLDAFRDWFLEAARHPCLTQMIITNGSLIDRDWAQALVRAQTIIDFSIDTVVPQSYARIRRGMTFERILRSLAHLREAEARWGRKVVKVLSAVVMEHNRHELPLLLPFAREHGFSCVTLNPCLPLDHPASILDPAQARTRAGERSALRDMLHGMESQAAALGLTISNRCARLLEPGAAARPGGPASLPAGWECLLPWHGPFISVMEGGVIYPGSICTRTPIGTIAGTSLTEAWNNEKMQEYRRRVLERRIEGWCLAECSAGRFTPRDYLVHGV